MVIVRLVESHVYREYFVITPNICIQSKHTEFKFQLSTALDIAFTTSTMMNHKVSL